MDPRLILIVLSGAINAGAVIKTWIPNTDFWNADNWNPKRLPCAADRVVFPPELDLGVLLPDGSIVLRELVLPRSGELLLPMQGELVITGQRKSTESCDGTDLVFTRTEQTAWLDPRNWQQHGKGDAAVPHLERVPCLHDSVVFPGNRSFRVLLPAAPVTVGSFRIGARELRGTTLSDYLASDAGANQFLTPDMSSQALRVGNTCWASSGCSCGASKFLVEAVCNFVRARCETSPPCLVPVQPLGHCCPICGAYLLLDYTAQFSLLKLERVVDRFLLKYPRVRGHVGKAAGSELVQVTLVDVDRYEGDSSEASGELSKILENNATLGLVRVMVHASGIASTATRMGRTVETLVGTFFAAVVTFALIFLVFVVYRHKSFDLPASLYNALRTRLGHMSSGVEEAQPFVFARFENVPGDAVSEVGEVELALAASDQVREYEEPPFSKSFDNPMYGNLEASAAAELVESATEPRVATHENPVYSELKRREDAAAKAERRGTDAEKEAAKAKRRGNDEEKEAAKAKRCGNDEEKEAAKAKRRGNDAEKEAAKAKRRGNDEEMQGFVDDEESSDGGELHNIELGQ